MKSILPSLLACAGAFLPVAELRAQEVVGGHTKTHFEFAESLSTSRLGSSVAVLGDLNGDGFAEYLVGAPTHVRGVHPSKGAAFLYSGQTGELIRRFDGEASFDRFGAEVSAAGDINGDGTPDFMVGAPETVSPSSVQDVGTIYVYSGLTLKVLYRIEGTTSLGRLGSSLAALGDINNDGFDDFIAGQPGVGFSHFGGALVYSGATGTAMRTYDATSDRALTGTDVACAGDIDADGTPDYMIGSPRHESSSGAVSGLVQVYSGATGVVLMELNSTNTIIFVGDNVAGAGDVNGDGFDDILLGIPEIGDDSHFVAGQAMVVSGADGSVLHHFFGERHLGLLGSEVAAAGDVDLDGYDDFLISAQGMQTVFLYSGKSGAALAKFQSEAADTNFGWSLATLGDSTGDGYHEFLIGAPNDRGWAGTATLLAFHPILSADVDTLSAATGGSVQFALDFPQSAATRNYQVLFSTQRGPIYRGVGIPLGDGKMMRDSKRGMYHFGTDTGLTGTLDTSGNASASMSFAAAEIPVQLVGHTFYAAAVAATNLSGNVDFSSVAVPLTVTP